MSIRNSTACISPLCQQTVQYHSHASCRRLKAGTEFRRRARGSLYLSCVDICKIPQEASQLPHTDYQQTVWLFSILASLVPHIYYSKSGFLINVCCVSGTMLSIQVFIIRHLSTHPFIHVSTHLPIQPFTQLIIYHPLIYSSILPPTLSCSSSY